MLRTLFSDPRQTIVPVGLRRILETKNTCTYFGLVTRLAGTNLFRRESSYGVAREGKLHCKEEGKLRIVCQVEGKLQIVVTSEGKFTPKSSRGGKTPNCVVEGKLQIVCQVEGKLQMVWSSGGKTPKIFERRENSSCFVEELRKTWTSNDTRLAGNCKLIRKRKLIWCGKGRENSIVTRRENS